MSAYNELVAKQLADVEEAKKKHRPRAPIYRRNKQVVTGVLRQELRYRRAVILLKKLRKWWGE